MSEHAWALEHVAAYATGGLDAAERERLEQHTAACAACARELTAARDLDHTLDTLFAGERPEPALEDRLIRALRVGPPRTPFLASLPGRLTIGAAAAAVLAGVGAGVSELALHGELRFPGAPMSLASRIQREGSVIETKVQDKPDDSNLLADGEGGENSGGWLSPDQLAQQLRGRALGGLGGTTWGRKVDGSAAAGEDIGLNPDKSTNYRVDRVEEVAVPGPVDATTATGIAGGPSAPTKDGGWARWPGRSSGPVASSFNGTGRLSPSAFPPALVGGSGGMGAGQQRGFAAGYGMGLGGMPGTTPQSGQVLGKDDAAQGKSYFQPGNLFIAAPATPGQTEGREKKPEAPALVDPASGKDAKPDAKKPDDQAPAGTAARKIILRSGDMEFEIDAFDAAVATVTKLVTDLKGGYVATVNSEKLPNGKVRGSIVVRVPPEQLDKLVLDLRRELGKAGELKTQRIGSQDITKQYTDLESRLKAARTMEERLLQIIKTGKGEVKDLLQVEKELGVWRTKIEELEGELRYYANLAALSTLTLTLTEKEIRAPASVVESERVQMGIEVEDVEQAQRDALTAVTEAKGRVTKAELKQHAAGQFSAQLHVEVAPEAAGTLRDRLKQLGNVARLEIDRVQQAQDGSGKPQDAKIKRGDVLLLVSLYNLVNVAPRETAVIHLVAREVPTGYRTLQDAVAKAKGRVLNAQLNEQNRQNITAQLDFEVRRGEEAALAQVLASAGDIYSRTVTRAPEGENVTDRKVRWNVSLTDAAGVAPRETFVLGIEVANVETAAAALTGMVNESQGRVVSSQLARERSGRVTAKVVFDVPLPAAAGLVEKFKTTGNVRVQQSGRNPQVPDGRLAVARLDVTLSNADLIVPSDEGVWPQIRRGLAWSFWALSWSLSWLIVALCVLLPWGLVFYGVYRLVLRLRGRPGSAPAA